MTRRPYQEWENVLLDTSIIFRYAHSLKNPGHNAEADFVKRVLDDLMTNQNKYKKSRKFYLSAITISEMLGRSTDTSKTEKIIAMLNVQDLTIASFDSDIAEFMVENYHAYLGTAKQNILGREWGLPNNDMIMVREWMTKDLMIVGTADYYKCDVVMTCDKNTMAPLADAVGYFCAVIKEENFNTGESGRFLYEYAPNVTYVQSGETQEASRAGSN